MAKQQPLSPEKYITTRARTLPIYKCYVTPGWEEARFASVVVMRRHVNGNFTAGLYLVDLYCLGVKDTFFAFNVSQEQFDKSFDLDRLGVEEADYSLAHNIVYAGHDFAMDFDIKPHKDFSITKFILEEDNDTVPLIEIPVGDENGNPKLMVNAAYNYAPVLQKLKQHAGEGNYTFYLADEDDDYLEDDDFDEDSDHTDDDAPEILDFDDVAQMDTPDLEEILESESYAVIDSVIIHTELLLRKLNEEEEGVISDPETLRASKDFKLLDNKLDAWDEAVEKSRADLSKAFKEIEDLQASLPENLHQHSIRDYLKLLDKYENDGSAFVVANTIPLPVILSQFEMLEENFEKYPPSVQLYITTYAVLTAKDSNERYQKIINAANVEMAYPFNRLIHGLHHKMFFLIKSLKALHQNDKEKLLHYHNLLRITGTGGHIKYLYATQLETWLKSQLGIESSNDEDYLDFEED